MKIKIRLETNTDALRLFAIAQSMPDENITITDGNGLRARACSLLGALSAMEYEDLWLESENNHYAAFRGFVADA